MRSSHGGSNRDLPTGLHRPLWKDGHRRCVRGCLRISGRFGSGKLGGKWGFIDRYGRRVIEARFDSVWSFSEGLAPAQMGTKWGYIDRTGEWAIAPRYDRPGRSLKVWPELRWAARRCISTTWAKLSFHTDTLSQPVLPKASHTCG
ncbi:MAG: WG repeat-containing protein [Acidobacteria bacterium]|nr:MAG: WG repeat-containing protein [Acidobacteriota bacterium]